MSYADLAAAAALSVADYLGEVPWEEAPEAKDWYMRVKSRPAFRPLRADQVRGVRPPEHYANLDF
jgi:glutathione S-transferase